MEGDGSPPKKHQRLEELEHELSDFHPFSPSNRKMERRRISRGRRSSIVPLPTGMEDEIIVPAISADDHHAAGKKTEKKKNKVKSVQTELSETSAYWKSIQREIQDWEETLKHYVERGKTAAKDLPDRSIVIRKSLSREERNFLKERPDHIKALEDANIQYSRIYKRMTEIKEDILKEVEIESKKQEELQSRTNTFVQRHTKYDPPELILKQVVRLRLELQKKRGS